MMVYRFDVQSLIKSFEKSFSLTKEKNTVDVRSLIESLKVIVQPPQKKLYRQQLEIWSTSYEHFPIS